MFVLTYLTISSYSWRSAHTEKLTTRAGNERRNISSNRSIPAQALASKRAIALKHDPTRLT